MQRDCRKAALAYARRGWRVFPLRGKKPYMKAWQHEATTNRKQIRRWWKRWPEANVAIACDSQRGPIVLDIDGPSGHMLLKSLDLPATREAISRPGRKHLYFDPLLDGTAIPRIIKVRKDGNKYDLDILGDRGYVIAPPSIHPETGKRYRWVSKAQIVRLPPKILQLVDGRSKKEAAPLPKRITEGERDSLLTSLAGSMRRRGASEASILAALREENATRVDPPLSDKQLMKIANSIAKKPPAGIGENLTDLGNARRFIAQHHEDVRSVAAARKSWMLWDGTRWVPDETGEVERHAKNTVRSLYTEASHAGDSDVRDQILKHAAKSEAAPRVRALLDLASTEPEISMTPDRFDADPWLFNVENGTVDLRTGELRKHDRADLNAKLAPVEYDPKAKRKRWDRFLLEIMNGDGELVSFLQRAVGYTLT